MHVNSSDFAWTIWFSNLRVSILPCHLQQYSVAIFVLQYSLDMSFLKVESWADWSNQMQSIDYTNFVLKVMAVKYLP